MRTVLIKRMLAFGIGFLLFASQPARSENISLISTGAVWKYLDDGSDQGISWQATDFEDASWATGPAPLGYGNGNEATTNSFGPDPNNKYITTYYRHAFDVNDPAAITNLSVRLVRDDGGIVYLNGTEIFRSNMPTGEVTYLTFALTHGDAQDTNFFARAVSSSSLKAGLNVLAVEIHQYTTNGPDIRLDLELLGNVDFTAPEVQIVCPTNGATLFSALVPVLVQADDEYDSVEKVELFAGDILLGQKSIPPYMFTCTDVPRGTHMLTAVAYSSVGLSATSAPVTVIINALVASNSTWSYFEGGYEPGKDWNDLSFDASAWPSGPGKLGFGGPVQTMLNRMNEFGDVNITYYFRHTFELLEPPDFTNLIVRLLRDDGGIVYLNGVEVFRSNMPEGAISADTLSDTRMDAPMEGQFYATNMPVSLLVPGVNVLAAEVHQCALTSSDLYFDLELLPNIEPAAPLVKLTAPVQLTQITPAEAITIQVEALSYDSTVAKVDFYAGNQQLGTSTLEPFSLTASNLAVGTYDLTAVATDFKGWTSTSAPVTLLVAGGTVEHTLVSKGADWKYLDDGSDQGTNWVASNFDDSDWPTGTAKFGTNQAVYPAVTIIRVGLSNVTTYFRKEFQVWNAGSYSNFAFKVLRDDGVVAYLNGLEVFRMNMGSGVITNLSQAPQVVTGTNQGYYFPTNISGNWFVEGRNVLAVELHQNVRGGTTIDAGFDLELTGYSTSTEMPTYLSIQRQETGLYISWTNSTTVLQTTENLFGTWSNVVPTASSSYFFLPDPASPTRYFRLAKP